MGVGHGASIFTSVAKFVCNTRPVFLFTHFDPTRSKSSLISPADPWAEGVGQGENILTALHRAFGTDTP